MKFEWKESPLWLKGALIGSAISLFSILIQGIVPEFILNLLRAIYLPAYFISTLCKGGFECIPVTVFSAGIVMVIEGFVIGLMVGFIISKTRKGVESQVRPVIGPYRNWKVIAIVSLVILVVLSLLFSFVGMILSTQYTSTSEKEGLKNAFHELCAHNYGEGTEEYNLCMKDALGNT